MKNVYIRLGIFVSVLALCCVLAWTGLRGRIDSDGGKEGMELIDYDFKKEFDIDVVWVDRNCDMTMQTDERALVDGKVELEFHYFGEGKNVLRYKGTWDDLIRPLQVELHNVILMRDKNNNIFIKAYDLKYVIITMEDGKTVSGFSKKSKN